MKLCLSVRPVFALLLLSLQGISSEDSGSDGASLPEGGEQAVQDSTVEESQPPFAFIVPPPPRQGFEIPHRQGRNWRHIQGILPYQPDPRTHVRKDVPFLNPNIHLNFRFDPYSGKRDNFHSSGPPRPRLAVNHPLNPNARTHERRPHPYAHHHQSFRQPTRIHPHHDISTDSRHRYYNQQGNGEPQGYFEQQRRPGFQGQQEQQDRQIDQMQYQEQNEGHTEDQNESYPYLEDQHPAEPDRETFDVPPPTESFLTFGDEASDDAYASTEQPRSTTGTRPSFLRPGNLAALLAGASSITTTSQEDTPPLVEIQEEENEKVSQGGNKTKTRTTVPEHIKPSTGFEYYDDLYDEFVDMYYDTEVSNQQPGDADHIENIEAQTEDDSPGKTEKEDEMRNGERGTGTTIPITIGTTQKKENYSTLPPTSRSTTQLPTTKAVSTMSKTTTRLFPNAPTTTTTTRPSTTTPTTTTTTTQPSTTTPTTTRPTTTTPTTTTTTTTATSSSTADLTIKKEKAKYVTTTSTRRSVVPPISLSEILQELGVSLPQFLGTLKTHGTSLKEFTAKLNAKSLSKAEFRRAKGNVKKILEILESNPDRFRGSSTKSPVSSTNSSTTEETEETTTSQTTVSRQPKLTQTISTTTTNERHEETTRAPVKPRVFGSRPGGISLTGAKSKSEENESTTSPAPPKAPLAIEIDIATLVKDKGVSAAEILQNFKTMFNISETKSSEQESETTAAPEEDDTTVSLRPYRKGAERLRPYRPLGYEGGSSNTHRRIVSNRLSSTTRPTIRPPYVYSPPSVTSHEEDSSSQHAKETILVEKDKEIPSPSNRDKTSNERKKYKELHSYNLVKGTPESLNVSTRSAIMAAGILGGVALSVFIAIFVVVKYRSHMHRHRRRIPLTLPSDSSSSSLPPIYASRTIYSKECYQTSGFWTTLKKRFDPYSPSSSPTTM